MDLPRPLKPVLHGWQIFFIAISGVIGGGVFNHNGEALEVAGPSGILVCLAIMGIVAIAVMEGVSELTQLFPAPNGIVQYVRFFVDKDLAWVVGIAYWYIYASVFATQNLAAATLANYWSVSPSIKAVVFYGVAPFTIFWINYIGVWWYGLIETFGGALKITLVLGASITLFVVGKNNGGVDEYQSSGVINQGFRSNDNFTMTAGTALCWVIPVIAYSFIGVEIVTIAAYEARLPSERRGTDKAPPLNGTTRQNGMQQIAQHPWFSWSKLTSLAFLEVPSRFIALFTFVLYMFCTAGEALNVKWDDDWLPRIYGGMHAPYVSDSPPKSNSMVVIAMLRSGHRPLAGFFTGCLIFSVLSAANTSLYVASRTLYGLARDVRVSNTNNTLGKWLPRFLSFVVPGTHTPAPALIASTLAFIWLPFISLDGAHSSGGVTSPTTATVVFEIIGTSASVSCMLVWASLCVAFIRYKKWIDKFKNDDDWLSEWKRGHDKYKARTYFGWMQPLPAYLGLLGCVVVVAFASATWWSTPSSVNKVLSAFLAPLIFVVIFVVLKLLNLMGVFNWEEDRWVRLHDDASTFKATIDKLRSLRRDQNADNADGGFDESYEQRELQRMQQYSSPGHEDQRLFPENQKYELPGHVLPQQIRRGQFQLGKRNEDEISTGVTRRHSHSPHTPQLRPGDPHEDADALTSGDNRLLQNGSSLFAQLNSPQAKSAQNHSYRVGNAQYEEDNNTVSPNIVEQTTQPPTDGKDKSRGKAGQNKPQSGHVRTQSSSSSSSSSYNSKSSGSGRSTAHFPIARIEVTRSDSDSDIENDMHVPVPLHSQKQAHGIQSTLLHEATSDVALAGPSLTRSPRYGPQPKTRG